MLLHHDFADEGRGRDPFDFDRQGVARLHAERRRIGDDVVSPGIDRSGRNRQRGVIRFDTIAELVGGSRRDIVKAELDGSRLGERSRDGGKTPPGISAPA